MNETKCWSLGPESDWCGEHDSELNVPDPSDPEQLICQAVADEWELIEGWGEGDPFTYMNACAAECLGCYRPATNCQCPRSSS